MKKKKKIEKNKANQKERKKKNRKESKAMALGVWYDCELLVLVQLMASLGHLFICELI
jgi:hypothetical protein